MVHRHTLLWHTKRLCILNYMERGWCWLCQEVTGYGKRSYLAKRECEITSCYFISIFRPIIRAAETTRPVESERVQSDDGDRKKSRVQFDIGMHVAVKS